MLLAVWPGLVLSQTDYRIFLAGDTIFPAQLRQPDAIPAAEWRGHTFAGRRYGLVQFDKVLTLRRREALRAQGVNIESYLPNFTYLVSIPASHTLALPGLRGLFLPEGRHKFSAALARGARPAYAQHPAGLLVRAFPHADISSEALAAALPPGAGEAIRLDKHSITLAVPENELDSLAAHPAVALLDLAEAPPVKEGLRGRTLSRINTVSSGPGTGLDGAGVHLAIADDGSVSHIDFTGRLHDFTLGDIGSHGDMTAGLAVGAGNLDPLGVGMAPGAELSLFSISQYPHLNNAPVHYADEQIVITSTSYGEGCGGWYSPEARGLDEQVRQNPALLHFFSAGNSAGNYCNDYGAEAGPNGERYGNITGGRKTAKNTLTVANLYYNDSLRFSSSRGPTFDGRIKPDISAQGQGSYTTGPDNSYLYGSGTSAAAPTAAGGVALLYQAYRSLFGQQDPPSGLIKALVLNTAEDLGRPGPDYEYGWGRIHVARALESLQQQQYFTGAVYNTGTSVHQLTVPGGVKAVRYMLYWTDAPGDPAAAKALVNDLDFTVHSPGGLHRPWVLSRAASIDSLTRPAWRGVDRVNNVEQVVIDDPAAGNYQLRVTGYQVPLGPQPYFVVYTFEYDETQLTYPAAGDALAPAEWQTVRWDAYGEDGAFALHYSTDSMNSWLPIAANIDGGQRYYDWQTPTAPARQVFLRLQRAGQPPVYSGPFSILAAPAFSVAYASDATALLSWTPVPGADRYDIYRLGDRFMERIDSTDALSYEAPIAASEEAWYSVRARHSAGGQGRRALGQWYRHLPCNTEVTLQFQFDQYPGETSWAIKNYDGEVLAAGGPYYGQAPHSQLAVAQCLPDGCYDLYVYDLYGDGLCCQNGDGSFQLLGANGEVLAAGDLFGEVLVSNFCLEPGASELGLHLVAVDDVSCYGGNDGSAFVAADGGAGGYTFAWSDGQTGPTAHNLAAGNHSVTVTDGVNGASLTVYIAEPGPLQLDLFETDAGCSPDGEGAASAIATGGTPPYQYQWSNGANGAAVSGLTSGDHSLTVTDDAGCVITRSFEIESGEPLQLAVTKQDVSCAGRSDGAIQTQVSGGSGAYQYQWSNGAGTAQLDQLPAGLYQLTVTDDGGCVAGATVAIDAPDPLGLTIYTNAVRCYGDSDGAATAFPAGGTAPYQLHWSDGGAGAGRTYLAAGLYTVTLTDENGCQLSQTATVAEPPPLALSLVGDGPAGIDLTVSGGTAPYAYQWSHGVAVADPSGLSPGDYTVTVTDHKLCTATGSWTIAGDDSPDYCVTAGSSTNFEWIESIGLEGQVHQSGNDGGYGDHTATSFDLEPGQLVSLVLTPGSIGSPFPENWNVWIDFNRDGDFADTGELVFEALQISGPVSGAFYLPGDLPAGGTRLRISMQYGAPPPACGTFGYGEAEDYNIHILGPDDNAPPADYCAAGGLTSAFEWIEAVTLGDLSHTSGNDGGYADYTHKIAAATAGEALDVSLTPGYLFNPQGQTWRIWADLNQDGDFYDAEELLFSTDDGADLVTGLLQIPEDALSGLTRLRVTMQWGDPADPCGDYAWGETEDYGLFISKSSGGMQGFSTGPFYTIVDTPKPLRSPELFPNPTSGPATVRLHMEAPGKLLLRLTDYNGRPIWVESYAVEAGVFEHLLPTAALPAGVYRLEVVKGKLAEVLRLSVK